MRIARRARKDLLLVKFESEILAMCRVMTVNARESERCRENCQLCSNESFQQKPLVIER